MELSSVCEIASLCKNVKCHPNHKVDVFVEAPMWQHGPQHRDQAEVLQRFERSNCDHTASSLHRAYEQKRD